jgi:RNA polymerase sigma factor (sigma-70 family)
VWQRWDRVGGMDDPVGYLYRTAMNLFRKRYRRAMLAVRRSVGLAVGTDDFADADDRYDVRHVLATLPPRQRAALVLTEMLGFTSKEAGDALGVTDATIRSLTRHGRDAFRKLMEVNDA